jgi:hypothetical protein
VLSDVTVALLFEPYNVAVLLLSNDKLSPFPFNVADALLAILILLPVLYVLIVTPLEFEATLDVLLEP